MSSTRTPGADRGSGGDGDMIDIDDLDNDDPGVDSDQDEVDDLFAEDESGDEIDEATVMAELDQARQRLASVPAAEVVANHAMGLFELAAIHLGSTPPHLDDARVAVDALGALVDGLGDRLGANAGVLRDALAQIRLAFVQVQSAQGPTT